MRIKETDNLESDNAANMYDSILKFLMKQINSSLKNLDDIEIFDGEGILMPCIDVLATLGEKYGKRDLLDAQTVRKWRESHTKAYINADLTYPKEFIVERLKVIAETFDRLEKLCIAAGHLTPDN